MSSASLVSIAIVAVAVSAACNGDRPVPVTAPDLHECDSRGSDSHTLDARLADTSRAIDVARRFLTVSPATATIYFGDVQAFTATLTNNGAVLDVTSSAKWWSTDVSVADVSHGLAKAVSLGSAGIVAEFDQRKATALLTVAPGGPVAVIPSTASLPVGGTQQFKASSAGQDVTASATWSTTSPAVATVDASGLATAKAPGITVVQASRQGSVGTATLTVMATTCALTIIPYSVIAPIGGTQQFDAFCTGGGKTVKVTTVATWTTSDPAIATVDAMGLSTALSSGVSQVTAQHQASTAKALLTVQ